MESAVTSSNPIYSQQIAHTWMKKGKEHVITCAANLTEESSYVTLSEFPATYEDLSVLKLGSIVEPTKESSQVVGIRFEGMSVPLFYNPTLPAGALVYRCGTSNPDIKVEVR
jgi:hypothetical protein